MTKEYFLSRAKGLYGDFYTYKNLPDNFNNKETITVTCKKHGDFNTIVCNFLNGRGCGKCNAEKRSNSFKEQYIEKSIKTHGNKYDYSKIVYVNAKTPVCIICPEHGEFWQTMDAHVHGEGCPECAKLKISETKTKTTEYFVKKSKEIHGNKYDYSKIVYQYNSDKVCIICPEHGEFWQTPNNHLCGNGCPRCSGKNKDTEEFIKEIRNKFGDVYDFSKAKYTGSKNDITLLYNGKEVTTKASKFLTSKKPITFSRVRCQNDFIEKARKIHQNKYDYSKVKYINNTTNVCIICPEHGEFWQRPAAHLSGRGCKECKIPKLEERVLRFLKEKNETVIHQYYPEYLSSGLSHQSIDIFIPKYNVGIECQGIQHFKDRIEYFSGTLEENIERDIRKYNKCKENVKLFYLIDGHVSMGRIIDNEKYGFIYTSKNTFKDLGLLYKNIVVQEN